MISAKTRDKSISRMTNAIAQLVYGHLIELTVITLSLVVMLDKESEDDDSDDYWFY